MKEEAATSGLVYEFLRATLPEGYPELSYEYMPSDTAKILCMSMQTLTGNPVVKRYKDGSKIARYRFALCIRQSNEDRATRLDAISLLDSIAAMVDGSDIPLGETATCWSVEQDTLPRIIASDDLYDDMAVEFTVEYHNKRKD